MSKQEEYIFQCKDCGWEGHENEIDVKAWEDWYGNEEEEWFCPTCKSTAVVELDEDVALFI